MVGEKVTVQAHGLGRQEGTILETRPWGTGILYTVRLNNGITSNYTEVERTTHMKLTLGNGMILEGTIDQITQAAKMLGQPIPDLASTHYFSETHGGYVEIATMNAGHLRNAASKIYRTWVEGLKGTTPAQFIKALRDGCTDPTFLALVARYVSLYNNGKL